MLVQLKRMLQLVEQVILFCRFSRWTWTFYCTISTSRISRADPFPLHQMSNTITYYILFLALFFTLPCQAIPTTQKNKIALQNSLMHDTDKQYFDVRQPYEDGICKKTGRRDIFTAMMCKLSRRIFKKIEVMQARHHMKDATNITLPS